MRSRKHGNMEQQRPPGFYPGGPCKPNKRAVQGEGTCSDTEDPHPHHSGTHGQREPSHYSGIL